MPKLCKCKVCEKFRKRMPENRLTAASRLALEKQNAPNKKSRRARIKAGVGKNGNMDQ